MTKDTQRFSTTNFMSVSARTH